jgi:hypothetical protein
VSFRHFLKPEKDYRQWKSYWADLDLLLTTEDKQNIKGVQFVSKDMYMFQLLRNCKLNLSAYISFRQKKDKYKLRQTGVHSNIGTDNCHSEFF